MGTDHQNKARRRRKSALPLILMGIGLIVIAVALVFFPPQAKETEAASTPDQNSGLAPGEMEFPAPDLTLMDLQNQAVSLADYRGQWVLVNNWATWCPPCRAEMPELNAYYEAHKDDGLILIGINSGESQSQIADFVQANGLSFPVWQDPTSSALRAFSLDFLPSTFVIDPSGTVQMVWPGAVSLEALETYVTPLLEN